ncbi:S-locus receptor kinase, C-terminal [Dillenia turbinata]|uniref:Receptor-like serine/threonine-protein kinase n=1 Tax=Dillenia turbinata TaxID=194707 RepID=A0AAN8YYZ9_9MAGN
MSLLTFLLPLSASLYTLAPNQTIKDGEFLVSEGGSFKLGFFQPGNSSFRFLGIWFNRVPQLTVVWVANRDNPINGSSGVLFIDRTSNLVLYDESRSFLLWSTNVSVNSSMVQLLDSGNLVLVEQPGQNIIWQSFDHPTDTMVSGMKLGLDRRTGLNRVLTSWKSTDDPGTGEYSFALDPDGSPEVYLYKGLTRLWRSGPWNGQRWTGIRAMTSKFIFRVIFVNNEEEVYVTWQLLNDSIFTRQWVDQTGHVQRSTWRDQGQQWFKFWSAPEDSCDNFMECGSNGICNPDNAPNFECTCLPGFEPKSVRDWDLRDGSGGCVRKRAGNGTCGNGAGFLRVARVKVPDTSKARVEQNSSLKACEQTCLKNCSCVAYSSINGENGCITWYGELLDTRQYPNGDAQDLHVRVDAIELEESRGKSSSFLDDKGMLAGLVVAIATLFILLVILVYWLARKKKKGWSKKEGNDFGEMKEIDENSRHREFTLFDLKTISAATKKFSADNMLGQGGFGLVYKGQLVNGQEIAVKRLSKDSGQGIEQFKNEVTLIAKLQHKNLVKLLGCCIEGEEKIGYMSPEYAMKGSFSEKSDVFSFGVLLLEIISGQRNNAYHHETPSLNLIEHVWYLWKEGRALDIVDPSQNESISAHEVSRCIQIGLLCVEEYAANRPTMLEVVFMLGNETTLPSPKQPAFIFNRAHEWYNPSKFRAGVQYSVNEVTLTSVEPR